MNTHLQVAAHMFDEHFWMLQRGFEMVRGLDTSWDCVVSDDQCGRLPAMFYQHAISRMQGIDVPIIGVDPNPNGYTYDFVEKKRIVDLMGQSGMPGGSDNVLVVTDTVQSTESILAIVNELDAKRLVFMALTAKVPTVEQRSVNAFRFRPAFLSGAVTQSNFLPIRIVNETHKEDDRHTLPFYRNCTGLTFEHLFGTDTGVRKDQYSAMFLKDLFGFEIQNWQRVDTQEQRDEARIRNAEDLARLIDIYVARLAIQTP